VERIVGARRSVGTRMKKNTGEKTYDLLRLESLYWGKGFRQGESQKSSTALV
jgi:hypothetical protein